MIDLFPVVTIIMLLFFGYILFFKDVPKGYKNTNKMLNIKTKIDSILLNIKIKLDSILPIYFPKKAYRKEDGIYLAIWNCGTRPQTLRQVFRDIRITIRKGSDPIFVIKKGAI